AVSIHPVELRSDSRGQLSPHVQRLSAEGRVLPSILSLKEKQGQTSAGIGDSAIQSCTPSYIRSRDVPHGRLIAVSDIRCHSSSGRVFLGTNQVKSKYN